MRVIGMMLADLEDSAIGLASRAAADLVGQPVLRRAVARALAAGRLERIVLLCPPNQADTLASLLGPLAGSDRLGIVALPAGRQAVHGNLNPDRVRLARRWALNCWRGGIGGACWFDELLAPAAMSAVARQLGADAVALLCPEAAIADAMLIDATVEQLAGRLDRFRMAISQAPPGLGTAVLLTDVLAELGDAGQTIGRVLAYDPANPRPDFIAGQGTVKLPIDVIACPHRLLADTARGLTLLERLIGQLGDSPTVEQATRAANAIRQAEPEPWPAELDIELTTRRAVNDVLRPTCAGGRGEMSESTVAGICQSLRSLPADDVVVTLGGCGDALLHPRVLEIAAMLKSAGALAVGIRTSGVSLTAEGGCAPFKAEGGCAPFTAEGGCAMTIDRLLDSQVDLVCVELDAATAEKYRELKGIDAFERVTGAMERLLRQRESRLAATQSREAAQGSASGGPLLVAEMIKCPATLAEMESFFDRWRLCDEAHLAGLHSFAGQFESVSGPGWPTAPPRRRPCVRVARRMTILADGTVPQCDIDINAAAPIGRFVEQGLAQLWRGEANLQLQADHRSLALESRPLCQACDQWNRP